MTKMSTTVMMLIVKRSTMMNTIMRNTMKMLMMKRSTMMNTITRNTMRMNSREFANIFRFNRSHIHIGSNTLIHTSFVSTRSSVNSKVKKQLPPNHMDP
jgi:uncharacterized protein YdiU (UPF0061 family)